MSSKCGGEKLAKLIVSNHMYDEISIHSMLGYEYQFALYQTIWMKSPDNVVLRSALKRNKLRQFFSSSIFPFFHILMHIINYNYTFSCCDAKDSECDDVSWKVRVECKISNKGTFIANIDPCIQLICSNLLRFKICISSYLEYIFQLERTFQLESLSYAW